VPAFGYVSLFPFLAALLPPDCPELGRTLDLILNEDLTWTDQGLRSLARSSSIYKK
jgi:mannosyl-oligosaccharide glucosidase